VLRGALGRIYQLHWLHSKPRVGQGEDALEGVRRGMLKGHVEKQTSSEACLLLARDQSDFLDHLRVFKAFRGFGGGLVLYVFHQLGCVAYAHPCVEMNYDAGHLHRRACVNPPCHFDDLKYMPKSLCGSMHAYSCKCPTIALYSMCMGQ